MTFSIVARDAASGAFGVAVASRFFAAGALCPHADGGVGALCTQALVNPTFGARGLTLLREGLSARVVVDVLVGADDGRAHRQLHVHDADGGIAVHTGADCNGWCGQIVGDGISVAGNWLTGARVLVDTATAYARTHELPFAQRLLAAMRAGEAAGGDSRGRQSAVLLIHTTEVYPALSLRADDHPDPLAELARLEAISRERFAGLVSCLPTRAEPAGLTDRAAIEARIASVSSAVNP